MTLSRSDITEELWVNLQELWMNLPSDDTRYDVIPAVTPYFSFIVDHNPTSHDAVELFWKLYKPKQHLPDQAEQFLLKCLNWMYEEYRVSYEPDSDDNLDQLVAYLNIAATRAFQIRRVEGGQWSEEALSCLFEVDRIQERLFAPRASKNLDSLVFSAHVHPTLGLCLVELSRALKNEGKYERALHYLAEGVLSNFIANDFVQEGDAWGDYQDSLPRPDEDHIEAIKDGALGQSLTDIQISLKEAVSF